VTNAHNIPDATLTTDGLPASGRGRVLVLACGALAREIIAIRDQQGLAHLDLHCLPAILHNRPDQIPAAVEQAVLAAQGSYDSVFVAYADCGTGGLLQATCDRLGVQMIAGPHCYSFFEGNAAFATHGEGTAFYLTDFLARQFDTFVIQPLGLDRHPQLRDMYFGNYTELVYLAQTDDAALDETAQAAAVRLGLAYRRQFTGYGDLAPVLAGLT
jgi:RES domain-containing protein